MNRFMCIPVHPRWNKLLFAKNQINGWIFNKYEIFDRATSTLNRDCMVIPSIWLIDATLHRQDLSTLNKHSSPLFNDIDGVVIGIIQFPQVCCNKALLP